MKPHRHREGIQDFELFADESRFPQLANPVQMQFDTKGRLWVAVWPTYPKWEPLQAGERCAAHFSRRQRRRKSGSRDRICEGAEPARLRVLERRRDRHAACRSCSFLKDTDGDDVADVRVVMLQGLDSSDTHHGANNLILRPDGGIYWQSGVFMQHNHEHPWGPSLQASARPRCIASTRAASPSRCTRTNSPNPHGIVVRLLGLPLRDRRHRRPRVSSAARGQRVSRCTSLLKKEVRPVTASEVVSSTHFPESMQGDFSDLQCDRLPRHQALPPRTQCRDGRGVGRARGRRTHRERHERRRHQDRQDKSRGFLMSGDKNFRPSERHLRAGWLAVRLRLAQRDHRPHAAQRARPEPRPRARPDLPHHRRSIARCKSPRPSPASRFPRCSRILKHRPWTASAIARASS